MLLQENGFPQDIQTLINYSLCQSASPRVDPLQLSRSSIGSLGALLAPCQHCKQQTPHQIDRQSCDATMSPAPRAPPNAKAYAGSPPTSLPTADVADFLFSDPFEHSKGAVPASQRVSRVADDAPIYVDNATGTDNNHSEPELMNAKLTYE